MPELRKDPVIGRWVIISTERGKRPHDFNVTPAPRKSGFCPFCPGNEDKTPPEIFAIRPPDTVPNSPGWSLRVVPNKYPALRVEGELNRRGEGIYDVMNGVGAHEVIIETPHHDKKLADLEIPHIHNILKVYRERIADLRNDIRLKYVLVFKNQGYEAGASLEHSHSQLIATPIVPKTVVEELTGARNYYQYKERCIFCDIVREEIKDQVRIIYEEEHFIAIEPFAPRFPFETWILPKHHESHYEKSSDAILHHLAITLKLVLQKLEVALKNPPYNFIIHTSPMQEAELPYYHWHIEIMPKLTRVAGFERGTGFYINSTSPEDAARYLKTVEID